MSTVAESKRDQRKHLVERARKLADFVLTYVKYNLLMDMEYRTSFITQVLGMVLNNTLWVIFWWIFFDRFDVVAGWALQEILLLFAVLTIGFGVAIGTCGNAVRMSRMIAEGHLDYYLAVPKPVLLHVLVSRSHTSAWGDVIFGFMIFGLSGGVTLERFALLLLGAALTALLILSFVVLAHSLAFWLGNAEGLAGQLFEALIAFSGYPASIFKGWARVMLFTIIPAGFISTVPVNLIQSFHWPFLAGFGAFAVGLGGFAYRVFHAGLRRYESGNLISLRM